MMRYLLLSILFHCLIIALIYGYKFPKSEKEKAVELLVFSSNHGKDDSGKSTKGSGKNNSSKNQISKFVPSYDTTLSGTNNYSGSSSDSLLEGKWEGNLIENLKNSPFISAQWRRINHSLIYPHDFIEQNIEGAVTVKLIVDRQGRLKDLVSVETPQILLELYITSFIYQVLQRPLPERVWSNADENPLVLHFDFRVSVNEYQAGSGIHHIQRSLVFERFSYYDGKINRAITQALEKYKLFAFPIPGGFYIDLVLLYKVIAQLAGEPTEEQARQKRLKVLKEELQRNVKAQGS